MAQRCDLPIAAILASLSIGVAIGQEPPSFEETGDRAAFRGIVIEAGTGQPLQGVSIHVDSRLSLPVAVTDATGRFVAEGLDPGTYRVFAELAGMVFTETCRDQRELPCIDLTLAPGQMAEVEMPMRRAAGLSGRVFDAAGDPVVGVRVSLQNYDYASGIPGERVLADFPVPSEVHSRDLSDCRSSLARELGPEDLAIVPRCEDLAFGSEIGRGVTNERGEWRLEGVPPGEYYAVVSAERSAALERALPGRQAGMWLPIYFPGTPFEDGALPVRVTSAPEVPGIDIQWAEHAPVSIRGTVSGLPEVEGGVLRIGGATLRPGGLDVTLTTANGLPVRTAEIDFLRRFSEQIDQTTGDFQFLVPPFGEYVLTATAGSSHSGRLRLDVGASDVDGIALPVVPAVDVRGQVLFDPPPPPEEVARVWVSFGYRSAIGNTEVGSPVSRDGTFVFENPIRRDWTMSVVGLPVDYYLEAASYGGVDLLRNAFNPADAPGSVVLVRAGNSPGQVTGRVVDARGGLVAGAKVTLVPEGTLGGRRDLYRSVETAAGGRFKLDTIPPGAYRVFAWESIPQSAERNTQFLAPYLGRGRFVTVGQNATVDIELPLIER